MLRHRHPAAGLLKQRPQLRQGFHGGERDHRHPAGPQALQHRRQHGRPLAATAAEQHPIGIGQLRQNLGRPALQHAGRSHPQPLGIGCDQSCRAAPRLQGPESQARPQPQRLEPHRTHAGADIPEHAALGQLQIGQQLNAHLPLGHQAGAVVVLEEQAVFKAE